MNKPSSKDLFVVLAEIGALKGACDGAAINHTIIASAGDAERSRASGAVFRDSLVNLRAAVANTIAAFDSDQLAIYADQLPDSHS